jgi:hypothetical protein
MDGGDAPDGGDFGDFANDMGDAMDHDGNDGNSFNGFDLPDFDQGESVAGLVSENVAHEFAGGHPAGNCFDGNACHGFDYAGDYGSALATIESASHGHHSAVADAGPPHSDTQSCCLPGVKLSGFARSKKQLQLLVWPHGYYNVRARLQRIATSMGLFDIVKHYQDINYNDMFYHKLLDTTPFDGRDHSTGMPSGWYPGAKGKTRTWTEYWQIGGRSRWWRFWEESSPQPSWRTYLIIKGSTWYYQDIGDYETRVAFSIYSISEVINRKHVPRRKYIEMHGKAADRISRILYDNISQALPSQESVRKRLEMLQRIANPPKKPRKRRRNSTTVSRNAVGNPAPTFTPVDPMVHEGI